MEPLAVWRLATVRLGCLCVTEGPVPAPALTTTLLIQTPAAPVSSSVTCVMIDLTTCTLYYGYPHDQVSGSMTYCAEFLI